MARLMSVHRSGVSLAYTLNFGNGGDGLQKDTGDFRIKSLSLCIQSMCSTDGLDKAKMKFTVPKLPLTASPGSYTPTFTPVLRVVLTRESFMLRG
ncbi:hypothetical protein Q5P01_006535 [Channa striata]|uniref:Uncharacterized protein n=1 Tax=Channa striata TaxID=64152 RepID=A0AA88NBI5_CHASR|nr:hypothetical protein Q5P01_006535 [Channa striata]